MEAKVSMDITNCEPFCFTTREDLEGNVGGAYTDPIFRDPAQKANAMNHRYVQSLLGGGCLRCNSGHCYESQLRRPRDDEPCLCFYPGNCHCPKFGQHHRKPGGCHQSWSVRTN